LRAAAANGETGASFPVATTAALVDDAATGDTSWAYDVGEVVEADATGEINCA
jgi:hypothetical protein